MSNLDDIYTRDIAQYLFRFACFLESESLRLDAARLSQDGNSLEDEAKQVRFLATRLHDMKEKILPDPADRNPLGYILNERREPVCPKCQTPTNKAYRMTQNLVCWKCGMPMKPTPEQLKNLPPAITPAAEQKDNQ